MQLPALPQLVSRDQLPAGRSLEAQAEASQLSSELQGEATQDSAGTQPASKGARYQVRRPSAAGHRKGAQVVSFRHRWCKTGEQTNVPAAQNALGTGWLL